VLTTTMTTCGCSVSWQQHSLAEYLDKQYSDYVKHINEINALLQSNYEILAPAFQEALGWEPIAPQGSMYGMFKHSEASDIEALQKGTRDAHPIVIAIAHM
jgi:DNA-binding transcriptional MocR family regulator